MHLTLEFIWRLESNLDNTGFVGLENDVFKSAKEGHDPATVVEAVGGLYTFKR